MNSLEVSPTDTSKLESIKSAEVCIENLKKLGMCEEEMSKLIEVVDAIIDNRLDALLLN